MINGIEGIPGSGKSYEAVAFHVLPALQAGRLVITNLPLLVKMLVAVNPDYADLIELRTKAQPVLGTWDASRLDEDGNGEAFQLFPDGYDFARHLEVRTKGEALQLFSEGRVYVFPATVAPFSQVWDYYTTWKHPKTGQGPLFIIDEVHVPLPRQKADEQVREWFSLHRHFNADVLLMSQRFRKIHPDISELCAMLVRCRKADILGRSGSYIRKVHAGYPGAVISTEERKYKPEIFGLYKSHTQGNSVAEAGASDVKPLTVQFRRVTWLVWLIAASFCVYAFWPKSKPEPKPVDTSWLKDLPPGPPRETFAPGDIRPATVSPSAPVASAKPIDSGVPGTPDPFEGKTIHLTGWMKFGSRQVYTFTIADAGRRIFDLQLADLARSGYSFQPLGECAGLLVFDGKSRPVTCDAPVLAVASPSTPIVVSQTTGRRSDDSINPSRSPNL